MVEEVTPNYYAEGVSDRRYVIRGQNFDTLPEDIKGWGAYHNDKPGEFIGGNHVYYEYHVVSRTDTEIVMQLGSEQEFSFPGFLGAITDDDLNVIWLNETAPIP